MLSPTRIIAAALLGCSALAGADTFLDGTHRVGQDIEPGVYQAPGGQHCKWAILGDDTLRGGGRDPIVEILAADFAFNSSGCGMWRAATETALKQHNQAMAIDAGILLIAALDKAILETADTATADIIYQRTRLNFDTLLGMPDSPPVSPGIAGMYLELLRGAE